MAATDKKLQRYKLIVSYDGTRYNGFQRQSKGENASNSSASSKCHKRRRLDSGGKAVKTPLTIQESLEDALEQFSGLSRSELMVRFAGRTDAGVHARGQVLVVSLPDNLGELWHIRKSVNSRLPVDISIDDAVLCENQNLDPRKDVKLKRYSYTLKYRRQAFSDDGKLLPICSSGHNSFRSGLDQETVWLCPWPLDDTKLENFCQSLTGKHDYSAFVHKHGRRDKDNGLTVENLERQILQETNEAAPAVTIRFQVEAKGFRRSMVRNLVGFLVDLCRGEVEESILDEIWKGTDEVADKIHSAPACGLCMEHVQY